MASETFSNQTIAAALNESAIPVLVDAWESPELAALLRQMAEEHFRANDWPICLWTTAELAPLNGGGYFPPTDDWGGQGFLSLARNVSEQWAASADELIELGEKRLAATLAARPPLSPAALAEAIEQASIPPIDTVELEAAQRLALLALAPADPESPHERARAKALNDLDALAVSAGFDSVSGGFHTGANDPNWRLPLFQKSAADQGLMLAALAHAIEAEAKPERRDMARLAEAFVSAALIKDNGLARRYLDSFGPGDAADALEGRYYLFNAEQVTSLDPAERALWNLDPKGNLDPEVDALGLYQGWSLPTPASAATLDQASDESRARLRAIRERGPRPLREEIGYTDCNALLVSGLVAISRATGDDGSLARGRSIFDALLAHSRDPETGALLNSDQDKSPASAYAHAAAIGAALDLFAATSEQRYLDRAISWERQPPQAGGLATLAPNIRYLMLRDYDLPAPAALQLRNLRRLAEFAPADAYQEKAEALLAELSGGSATADKNQLSLLAEAVRP